MKLLRCIAANVRELWCLKTLARSTLGSRHECRTSVLYSQLALSVAAIGTTGSMRPSLPAWMSERILIQQLKEQWPNHRMGKQLQGMSTTYHVDFVGFPQCVGMFSLSEIIFNFLSASTWIILENKMLSEKSRLQRISTICCHLHICLKYTKHRNVFYECIYIYMVNSL